VIPREAATEVVWSMGGPRALGTRVFGELMNMDEVIGRDLQKGLSAVKAIVERTPG
jgi:hypothetical protein